MLTVKTLIEDERKGGWHKVFTQSFAKLMLQEIVERSWPRSAGEKEFVESLARSNFPFSKKQLGYIFGNHNFKAPNEKAPIAIRYRERFSTPNLVAVVFDRLELMPVQGAGKLHMRWTHLDEVKDMRIAELLEKVTSAWEFAKGDEKRFGRIPMAIAMRQEYLDLTAPPKDAGFPDDDAEMIDDAFETLRRQDDVDELPF